MRLNEKNNEKTDKEVDQALHAKKNWRKGNGKFVKNGPKSEDKAESSNRGGGSNKPRGGKSKGFDKRKIQSITIITLYLFDSIITWLNDLEVTGDNEVDGVGDIVHFALFLGTEPLNLEEALKEKVWKKMVEELSALERNQTR